jgi:glycosyltransferase involved in cell wall biosynthesis
MVSVPRWLRTYSTGCAEPKKIEQGVASELEAGGTRGIGILIPALNPAEILPTYVERLRDLGFTPTLVINDGSDPSYAPIFDRIAKIPGCEVIHHAVNLGKGRALKTGLNHLLVRYPNLRGVVTFDADGQHKPEDALLVANALTRNPTKLVVGSRVFSRGVPWKSLAGNLLTRWLFAFFAGQRVSDTQSGLRGIPRAAMPGVLHLAGERYEYEMNMLISAPEQSLQILEQPIQTVYIEGNKSSHFNPVLDSMRVAFVLVRFYLSALFAGGLDLAMFAILYHLTSSIFWSLMATRAVIGPLVNFGLNKTLVFHNRSSVIGPLLRYYILLSFSGTVAFFLIRSLSQATGWNVILCKVIVEAPLSLFNFAIQRFFVFGQTEEEPA